MRVLLILLLSLCTVHANGFHLPDNFEFDGCTWLAGEPDPFKLEYAVRMNDDRQYAVLQMTARTTGWIGLGISIDGTMTSNSAGSDMFIGWVSSEGDCKRGCVLDYFAKSTDKPTLDTELGCHNDVIFSRAEEVDGHTTLTYIRVIENHDKCDLSFSINHHPEFYLIYAIGDEDPLLSNEGRSLGASFDKHRTKGSRKFDLKLHGTCPNSAPDATYQHTFVNAQNTLEVQWKLTHSQGHTAEMEYIVKGKTEGWVAIGLSHSTQPTMPNTDMIVGWVTDGKVHVVDTYASGYAAPKLDDDLGGSQDVHSIKGSESQGITTIHFKRPVHTQDTKLDFQFNHDDVTLLWAYGTSDPGADISHLKKHKESGFSVIKLSTGISTPITTVSETSLRKPLHGFMMFLSWGILTPISIYIARYLNPNGRFAEKASVTTTVWLHYHSWLQITAVVFCIISFITIVSEIEDSSHAHFDNPHSILGLIVFILSLIQPALGFLADYAWEARRTQKPIFPDIIHHLLGRALVILTFISMCLGLEEINADVSVKACFYIACFCGASYIAYHEYRMRKMTYGPVETEMSATQDDRQSTEVPSVVWNTPYLVLGLIAVLMLIFGLAYNFSQDWITNSGLGHVSGGNSGASGIDDDQVIDPDAPTNLCTSKDCIEFSIRFDTFEIPKGSFIQYCKAFQVPVETTYQITELYTIRSNVEMVHHAMLYTSSETFSADYWECPDVLTSAHLLAAFGKKGSDDDKSFKLPDRVGYQMGKQSDIKTLILQVRYINPAHKTGQLDSSGFHLLGTKHLYPNIAQFGSVAISDENIKIPPGKETFQITGFCPLSLATGSEIQVFDYGLVMRTHGAAIHTEVHRGSQYIGSIGSVSHYLPGQPPVWRADVVLKDSDKIYVSCTYNSADASEEIMGVAPETFLFAFFLSSRISSI
eukprot:TRINITY_DN6655_c0_g1_i2.p1 TRINITY_DN6655_c0_g1~~TRINITY_DN6655_c0_g1_i2.p1  ORF type:complete len:929 (-),score=140.21 TRINITY_DN6655_c0_g1_i2:146-2932(-)